MTYCARELRAFGVGEDALRWRCWRRGVSLTQLEAAALAELNWRTVHNYERGRTRARARTRAKLQQLMQRWGE